MFDFVGVFGGVTLICALAGWIVGETTDRRAIRLISVGSLFLGAFIVAVALTLSAIAERARTSEQLSARFVAWMETADSAVKAGRQDSLHAEIAAIAQSESLRIGDKPVVVMDELRKSEARLQGAR